jgi:hypothetical protein
MAWAYFWPSTLTPLLQQECSNIRQADHCQVFLSTASPFEWFPSPSPSPISRRPCKTSIHRPIIPHCVSYKTAPRYRTTCTLVHPYTHTHPELINKQNRGQIALTSSLPSARPSPFSVFRPWLQRRCPNYRSVLRRLVPLRLSCSCFSFDKSPHGLSRISSRQTITVQILSIRKFDTDNRSRSGDGVGSWVVSQEQAGMRWLVAWVCMGTGKQQVVGARRRKKIKSRATS